MKTMRRGLIAFVLCFALVLSLAANFATTKAAEKPSISNTKLTMAVKSDFKLSIKNTKDKVTWKSSDAKIAKVTSKGNVTAVKVGEATVTAAVGSSKLNCKITVARADTVYKPFYDTWKGGPENSKVKITSKTFIDRIYDMTSEAIGGYPMNAYIIDAVKDEKGVTTLFFTGLIQEGEQTAMEYGFKIVLKKDTIKIHYNSYGKYIESATYAKVK